MVQGSYTFQLKVVDNNGASGTDTVNVTVLSATNISPIAKAGNDTAITLPLNYLTLNGKGIDQDGNEFSLPYDFKTSIYRTHPVFMFVHNDYSLNNLISSGGEPYEYNASGLPINSSGNFLERSDGTDLITYECGESLK